MHTRCARRQSSAAQPCDGSKNRPEAHISCLTRFDKFYRNLSNRHLTLGVKVVRLGLKCNVKFAEGVIKKRNCVQKKKVRGKVRNRTLEGFKTLRGFGFGATS
jgi:hypothetical protein